MSSRYSLPPELDIDENEDFNKDRLDRAFAYLVQQLLILQSFQPQWEDQLNSLRGMGLQRLNEALTPIYEALVGISQVGIMFNATSNTPGTVGTGIKTFVVSESDRVRFAAAGYLSAQDDADPVNTVFGLLQSYDRDTGTLTILVDQFTGEAGAAVTDWRISAAASPNVLTGAHQVGAYTQAEVDAMIAAVNTSVSTLMSTVAPKLSPTFTGVPKGPTATSGTRTTQLATTEFVTTAVENLYNFLTNGAGAALDQLNELAQAIGNDPNFSATMLAGLANRVRIDASQNLTEGQKAQARANIGAQVSLGFTPVQQFGGNAVKLGWDGSNLRAVVDNLTLGTVWTEDDAVASLLGTGGYQRLPTGLIVQWGSTVITLDGSGAGFVTYPLTFPNECFTVTAANGDFNVSQSHLIIGQDGQARSLFYVKFVGSGAGAVRVNWMATGR